MRLSCGSARPPCGRASCQPPGPPAVRPTWRQRAVAESLRWPPTAPSRPRAGTGAPGREARERASVCMSARVHLCVRWHARAMEAMRRAAEDVSIYQACGTALLVLFWLLHYSSAHWHHAFIALLANTERKSSPAPGSCLWARYQQPPLPALERDH